MNRDELTHYLIKTGALHTPRIISAFRHIDRADFVLPEYRKEAYENYPLPIGHEQTISQPETVAMMLEWLSPKKGERVLDIGSGSGWTTALLGHIVGETGDVVGLEIVPELVEKGSKNLATYNFHNAHIEYTANELGLARHAPYQRILVSAAGVKIPDSLLNQLDHNGTLVIPIRDSIVRITKDAKGKIQKESFEGFAFVPLIEK